ncbi:MAG TPA: chloride channel protein [Kofleriaceae bacterium]|nr:chloride channel protein [Kofleriaceae bacterium]
MRGLVSLIAPADQPLELQILGRTLLHAALVGFGAGVLGCAFFAGAELLQNVLLEQLAGYEPLRAHGERVWGGAASSHFRWWLLAIIPALGALVGSLFARLAPECRGGGGDATIEAFHHHGGAVRRRVLWVKPLASIATLGAGGSGGREGPTMQIGAALGSTVGRHLRVTPRERRVLMVAGVAAGISAVFRAPLGAALIAIEMLYRDDFESEALIPSVLASVIAYSVSISVFGQTTLFGHLEPFAFKPAHIPLYIGLAIVVSVGASLFVGTLRLAQRLTARMPIVDWARPAIGGLLLGVFVVLFLHFIGPFVDHGDRGLGILGGGYGASQVAITGADWLPLGWRGVQILVLLAAIKIVASSLTIGTGGSAGDFAPALAIGALLGGAFGLAARLLFDDPTIHPGAFALVGMGTFYGGIANTPLAALVLVCEMAGSYELLVPLMLAGGVAFVALRRVTLYTAQVPTLRDSPAHRRDVDPLSRLRCADVLRRDRAFVRFAPQTRIPALTKQVEAAADQDVFPIVDSAGALQGVIAAEALRVIASNPELHQVGVAADLMMPAVSIPLEADLRSAAQLMVARDLRSVPVIDADGSIVGILDEHDIASATLDT